jgi:hypothetical protein
MFICFPLKYVIWGEPEKIDIFGHEITIPGHPIIITEWICHFIPEIVLIPNIPIPDPEKLKDLGKWLETEGVNPLAIGELSVIATMARLSNILVTPEAQGFFHDSLVRAVSMLDLPIEARVTFNGQVIREHRIPNVVDNAKRRCE